MNPAESEGLGSRRPLAVEEQASIGVRDEEVGKGTLEHRDTNRAIVLKTSSDSIKICPERDIEEVDRRVVDRDPRDARVDIYSKRC